MSLVLLFCSLCKYENKENPRLNNNELFWTRNLEKSRERQERGLILAYSICAGYKTTILVTVWKFIMKSRYWWCVATSSEEKNFSCVRFRRKKFYFLVTMIAYDNIIQVFYKKTFVLPEPQFSQHNETV